MSRTAARSRARAAARLAAVQALYQHEMEGTAIPQLLTEFHNHRLGATIEDVEYADADIAFFDDLVSGTQARLDEIDRLIAARLSSGWSFARLDKPMKAILRVGTYELLARSDVPVGASISEYVDVADAFYERREKGFVNGILDAVAKDVRGSAAGDVRGSAAGDVRGSAAGDVRGSAAGDVRGPRTENAGESATGDAGGSTTGDAPA